MDSIGTFITNAKGLTKNPLGIIALFISLIYGFACLVLGSSINNLKTCFERLPLIWFIILFPILILFVFVYLVINHHEKLYAPSDFKNEDNFMKSMDKKSQSDKINDEVKLIVEEKKELSQNTNKAVEELSHKDVITLKQNYLLAEDLSLKEFSLKYNVTIQRNMRISIGNSKTKFEFDGIAKKDRSMYVIEVKYVTLSKLSKRLTLQLQEYLRKIQEYYNAILDQNKIIPTIIIVSEDSNFNLLKHELKDFINGYNFEIKLEIYSFEDLKNSYGIK